jgi:hypothetical protein
VRCWWQKQVSSSSFYLLGNSKVFALPIFFFSSGARLGGVRFTGGEDSEKIGS